MNYELYSLICCQVEQEEKRIQDSLKEFLDAEKVANDGTLPAQLATPKKVRV